MTETVAVTGATGYLGGLLTDRFTKEGWDVVRLVRSPVASSDRRFQLGEDVSVESLDGIDLLIHAAYDMKLLSEPEIWRVNVEGTRRLLETASKVGIPRTIVISSMSAYPGTKQLYGRAKLDIEEISTAHGAIIVRPGLVMGDGAGGMAGALVKMLSLPVTPTIAGGRQFPISGKAFVQAMYLLATAPDVPKGPVGIASENSVSFDDLLRSIAASSGQKPPRLIPIPWQLIHAGLRAGERLGLNLPFRSDSLLGLVQPAPFVPGLEALKEIGFDPESTT